MKKTFGILFLFLISLVFCMPVNAEYARINEDGDYEANVDKFVPQRRVEVKTSKWADAMENGISDFRSGKKPDKGQKQNYQRKTHQRFDPQTGKRIYKWF